MRRFIARLTAAVAAFRTDPVQADNALTGGVSAHGTVVQARDIDSVHLDRSQRIERASYLNHGIAHVGGDIGPVIGGATGPVNIGGTQITGTTAVHTGTGHQINHY